MSETLSREQFFAERNQAISHEFSSGVPLSEIGRRFGMAELSVYQVAKKMGAKRPKREPKEKPQRVRKSERDALICTQYLSGRSLEDVGQEHGITRERVRQILVRDGHEERHEGYLSPRRVKHRELRAIKDEKREAKTRERDERRRRVRELYNSGLTYDQLAETLNHPISLILNDLWVTGGPSRNALAGKAGRRLTAEKREEIARRYAAGEPKDALAAEFNIVRERVGQIANHLGAYRR